MTGVVAMGEKPIEAASVTASQSDGLCFKWVRTNSKGKFRITGIPEGDYRIMTEYDTGLDPNTFQWSRSPGEHFVDFQKVSVNKDLTINIDLANKKVVEFYKKAIELADDETKIEYKKRLEAYKANKPWRE